MKGYSVLLLVSFLFVSCTGKKPEKPNTAAMSAALMDADRAFSKVSEIRGLKFAYIQYIDSSGILLRPNTVPLIEGNAMDFISRSDDASFTMTWEPKKGFVASSGEMGYTYGIYSLKRNDADSVMYGTYVTIWKKQPDGKWKFVLHSGNEGVE